MLIQKLFRIFFFDVDSILFMLMPSLLRLRIKNHDFNQI
jgi:hypothetical protein